MLTHKDYYATLGVKKTATQDEIREAFRKAARKYHPDLNPGDKRAEERFSKISESNDVLSNAKKRKIYDQLGFYSDESDPAQPEVSASQQHEGKRLPVDFGGFDFSVLADGVPGQDDAAQSSAWSRLKDIFLVGLSRGWLLLLLLVVVVAWGAKAWYRNDKAKEAESVAMHERAAAFERSIADLRSHYNPVTDWPKQIEGKDFTVDIEPIFVRADHRPILFYAMLEDIKGDESGKVFLYLMTIQKGPPFRLILDCSGCDLQALKESYPASNLAVVAQITAAQKNIESTEDAPAYVLNGQLVDARNIGDDVASTSGQ